MQEFEEVYARYYPQIYKYVFRLCGNADMAEEITQETFFKVFQKLDSYRGECKLSVWMCQIAKNTFYGFIKKQNRQTDYPIETIPDESNLEISFADKDLAVRIHAILHGLEEPYREVFWMRTFGEMSFAQIAALHQKTESWARVTYHRAKMKIMEELD